MTESPEERKEKQREYARAHYAKKKAALEAKRGAPTRAYKKPGGRRVQETAPRTMAAAAIGPASPVNGITIHTEHSIVSVTTEGGATVIRVREVGREG